jgi:hypothetical protein
MVSTPPPLFLLVCLSMPPSEPEPDSQFDPRGYYNSMKKYGKAYRHRSIELIRLCRLFPRTFAFDNSPDQYYAFQQ